MKKAKLYNTAQHNIDSKYFVDLDTLHRMHTQQVVMYITEQTKQNTGPKKATCEHFTQLLRLKQYMLDNYDKLQCYKEGFLLLLQAIPHVPQQFETSGLRILFDVSFFIIVTTIGLNIVFGIIVDTFTELRDERVCCLGE